MGIVSIGPLAALLALSDCCLSVVTAGTGNYEETTGSTGALTTGGSGSTTAGSSSSGGTTTGAADARCSGVYCSPAYVCDPADGICKCGGQICGSGNCDADSGACLAGCPTDAGTGSIAFRAKVPGEATILPEAILGMPYSVSIATACESEAVEFTALSSLTPLGLALYPSGQIEGVPTMTTGAVPFEFEVEGQAGPGVVAFQNFLLFVQ